MSPFSQVGAALWKTEDFSDALNSEFAIGSP